VIYAAALLTPGAASSVATSVPSFASATRYATGRLPTSAAIGDLNGDGKRDLATANVQGNTVSVLLNKGDGRFQARHDYRTGRSPIRVAIGDLNGDRKPDLAAVNRNERSTVSVLLNRGDGTFAAPVDCATGPFPSSIAIGDLNGDGRRDLAIGKDPANTVAVFLNKGDGSFSAPLEYPTGRLPSSVAIGDLNGDGRRDLVSANYSANTVSVLLNRGEGALGIRRDYRTGRFPSTVVLGDLNGDGKVDLATANSSGDGDLSLVPNTVSVLLNTGAGRFGARRDYRTGDDPRSVAIGDLNGDGRLDLATANFSQSTVSVLLNRGHGNLQLRLDYRIGPNAIGYYADSVALADLNGDGKGDLAITNPDGNVVSVLLATGSGVCVVPKATGKTLPAAKRAIARAHCRVGKIGRAYSKLVKSGRVISEDPTPRTVLRKGAKVNLVVSRGRRP
jgi:hypothetical protein